VVITGSYTVNARDPLVHENLHLHEPSVGVARHPVGDHARKGDKRLGHVTKLGQLPVAAASLGDMGCCVAAAAADRLDLLVLVGHARDEEVGDVAPELVRQQTEVGHHDVNVALAERNDLKSKEVAFCLLHLTMNEHITHSNNVETILVFRTVASYFQI
jgi:hypothetical protein